MTVYKVDKQQYIDLWFDVKTCSFSRVFFSCLLLF